jgi:CubicO group peptidase (beta-lactamase class C family)
MKRHLTALLWLACVLLQPPTAVGATPSDAQIDRLFATWTAPGSPGAALTVVRDGAVVFSRGYGLAHLEHAVPITPSTTFHVASLSKQFTAFAIHLLAQEGKLQLDDPVRRHVPELTLQGPPITLRHLLHHTSGLRDQWTLLRLAGLRLDDNLTQADVLALLGQQRELNFEPGSEELYSNSGYTLLGLVVQRVSGQSLADFARERIFLPLGMTSTRFQTHYGDLVPGRAASYERVRDRYRGVALSYSTTGATNLLTTAEDLVRWDRNFNDARVGGPSLLVNLQARSTLTGGRESAYASGLLTGHYRGQPVVEHGGVDAGFRAHLLRLPTRRLTVILLGNTAELQTGELARRVADLYLEGESGVEPLPVPVPELSLDAAALAPYVGVWEVRPGFVMRFTVQGHTLRVQATAQPPYALAATAPDRFVTRAFPASVTFAAPDASGLSGTATWRQGGRELPLRRLAPAAPDAEALQRCAGDFYSDELRTLYRLSVRDGTLRVRYPRGEVPLTPLAPDLFEAPSPLGSVWFQRGPAGGCDGFAVTAARVRGLRFVRVSLAPVR